MLLYVIRLRRFLLHGMVEGRFSPVVSVRHAGPHTAADP
jgi:hypothetical protein